MTDCVEFEGYRTPRRYGVVNRMHNGKPKMWRAHRWVWTQANGAIPEGMVIMHTCDNPPCVNLEHLRLGTQGENIADRHRKARDGAPRGEAVAGAKLDTHKVKMIRLAAFLGASPSDLARMYGVTRQSISKIVQRRTWRHVA